MQTTTDAFAFPELSTLESNIAITQERILNGAARVWLRNDRVAVYQEHDKSGVLRYFATDIKADPTITIYCVRLDYLNLKPLRAGCQIGVWCDTTNDLTIDLARDVFWKILFKSHDMISDSVQTEYGKRFWQKRLKEAFEMGYYVYGLRYTHGKIKDAHIYRSMDELRSDSGKIWTSNILNQSRRLLIASKPIDFASYQKTYHTE